MSRLTVTEAESEVLAALWRKGQQASKSLVSEVQARNDWGEATIKTLLGRLMRKGAVRSDRVEGLQRYSAAVSRADYVRGEVGALTARLYGGDRQALLDDLAD
ncbi:MAG: BlaI/MecI/CopY family transcriptional regulator [Brevundimonas sp.]